MKQGKTLDKICEERGIAISTIQGHVLRISVDFPDVDIAAYRPYETIMKRIQKAYKKQDTGDKDRYGPDGKLKSNYLFNELQQQVDYGTIKLAYVYLDI